MLAWQGSERGADGGLAALPTTVIMSKKKGIARATAGTASGGTTQRVLAGAEAAMEHVGTTETEAKDRVERIMRTLTEKRWNRKRKLLPNLRLVYPSDDESRHVAELAKVNNASRFGEHIRSIILDAHLHHATFLKLSITQKHVRGKRVRGIKMDGRVRSRVGA